MAKGCRVHVLFCSGKSRMALSFMYAAVQAAPFKVCWQGDTKTWSRDNCIPGLHPCIT